jgi:lipid-A-disaccharide synthase-like uncharacterized protein
MIEKLINSLSEPWVLIGLFGQGLFFLRFVVQWIASEKKGESYIPFSFWVLSILGSLVLLCYSIYREDVVFMLAFSLNVFIYIRNIILIKKPKKVDKPA